MKLLNNPRSRSLLAGTLGGLIGWLLAELLFELFTHFSHEIFENKRAKKSNYYFESEIYK